MNNVINSIPFEILLPLYHYFPLCTNVGQRLKDGWCSVNPLKETLKSIFGNEIHKTDCVLESRGWERVKYKYALRRKLQFNITHLWNVVKTRNSLNNLYNILKPRRKTINGKGSICQNHICKRSLMAWGASRTAMMNYTRGRKKIRITCIKRSNSKIRLSGEWK